MENYPPILSFNEADKQASENSRKKLCATTKNLLLGNGFSQSYYGDFGYETLYKAVEDGKELEKVREVFDYLGESNFEGVLQMLQDSAKVGEIYGVELKGTDLFNLLCLPCVGITGITPLRSVYLQSHSENSLRLLSLLLNNLETGLQIKN